MFRPNTRELPKKNVSNSFLILTFPRLPHRLRPTKMSAVAALRNVTRAGPARLVAGMRISSIARPVSRFAPSMTRTTGVRPFSVTAGCFGSGSSK